MVGRRTDDDWLSLPEKSVPVKAIQPRAVLGLLLVSSFIGVWIAHLGQSVLIRLITWSVVVAIGLLAGGLYWRLVLFDPAAFEDDAESRYVRTRWRRLEAISVWGLSLAGLVYLTVGTSEKLPGPGGVAFASGVVFAPLLWFTVHRHAVGDSSRRKMLLRSGLFVVVLVSLSGFARIETGPNPLDWLVRLGHLGSFALWLGGAGWHNFVVLPTVRAHPGAKRALKSQARTFRRHLPVVIVVLLVTGAYQSDRLVGLSVSALLGSPVGHLIGVKISVLLVLIGLVVATLKRNGG
ncbi:MAG: hypothetical protein ABEI98_08325 [Halorhabdus sp.]